MRRCSVCEGILEDSSFQNGDSVCRVCCARISYDEGVRYTEPERKTIRQAYTDLMLAIKQQAYFDREKEPHALQEWEEFWLRTEPWPKIWDLLKTTMEQGDLIRNDLQKKIGGKG